jgi:hypothetical protein
MARHTANVGGDGEKELAKILIVSEDSDSRSGYLVLFMQLLSIHIIL